MSLAYLILPRIEVRAANARSTAWLINAAPVMAAHLFAHNLGRRTGHFPLGTAILHHHAQFLGDFLLGEFRPQQRRGAVFIDADDYSSRNRHALSLQPTASCHLRLSLVLAYDGEAARPRPERIADFLGGARLAGGQIIGHGPVAWADDAESLRARLPSGYWIVERQDLMDGADAGGDPLDALIAACGRKPRPVKARGELPGTWIVPTTLGYALLNPPGPRPGARDGYPHAYAEPLVGLVQYLSTREPNVVGPPLWRAAWIRDDVFIVTQSEILS